MAGAVPVSAQIEVAADSRVGIGTSTPEEKVDVRDANGGRVQFDPADGAIEIGSGNDAISYIDFKGSANLGSDYHGRILYADGSGFEMAVAGGLSAIKVAENGNVGVGTIAPAASLDIWKSYSAGTDSLRFSFNDGTAYWMGIQPYVAGAGNVGYRFRTNNGGTTTDALAVTGMGRVGIGTISPRTQLHLYNGNPGLLSPYYAAQLSLDSEGNSGVAISTPTANAAYIFHTTPLDGASAGIKMDGSSRILTFFTVNGTERMRIDQYGNVGVGTTALSHKLTVSGSVRASSFISDTTSYADFVFKPGYRLAPLAEVEAYINEHGHLPDIPSETEAREQGIDLASMQVKLLQKIEELTLHMIALKKDNERLSKEVGSIKRNSDL